MHTLHVSVNELIQAFILSVLLLSTLSMQHHFPCPVRSSGIVA